MHDTSSMSTFEKYVVGTSALSQEQMDACKVVQKALGGWGVSKTVEEVVLLKGLLDAEQMSRVLADIKEKWKISIPRPVLYSVAEEKDKALQDQLVQQSPKTASQVLECRKIQESAKQLGVALKVSEILIAKGYFASPGPAPAAPAKAEIVSDDLLPDEPAPEKKPAPMPSRKPVAAARPTLSRDRERGGTMRPGPGRDREGAAAPAPKKKNPMVLWLSVGGAAAAVLVIVLVVALSGSTAPPTPPPKPVAEGPKGKQVVLYAEGLDRVPVYTEAELLEMHASDDPKRIVEPSNRVAVNTPVTLLKFLRTRKLWYNVRTPKGTEGWVVESHLKATFDLADERVSDFRQEWEEKLVAKKGGVVAKAPETARTDTTPKPLEVPKPAPTPEPAARPAPTPEPVKPVEPAPAPAAAPGDPLVAHWKFDEGNGTGAADASSRSNGLKLVNGAAWVSGPSGKAISFDGVDDYASAGIAGMPAANAAQTVAGWYSVPSAPQKVQTMVLLEGSGSGVQVGFRNGKLAAWKHGGQVLVQADAPSDPARPSQGLHATYYSDQSLSSPSLQRYDPQVNFDWGQGAPDSTMASDGFSVRWKGRIEAPISETYTLYAVSDDGVRVWVDGKPVVDRWMSQQPTESKGTVELKAKTKAEIVVEYFENGGGASIKLSWSCPGLPKEIIPPARFSPPAGLWHHFAYTYDGTTHGLYVDGALKATNAAAPATGAVTKVELGRYENASLKEYFKGALDDVRIYAAALDASDVRALAPDAGVAMAAAGKPSPAGAPAQPGPSPRPPSSDPKREAREKKAQEIWDAALQFEKEGKLAEAQEKFRELRTRYRSTSFYWDKMIELTDKINEIGQRLAVGALTKTALYRKPHQDSWYSYEFLPPDGWKGVPPQPNWFGEQDNDESFYRGRTYQIARYTAPYFDNLNIVVLKTFACENVDFLESKVTGELQERYKGLKEESKQAGAGKAQFMRKLYSSTAGDRLAVYYFFQDRKGIALVCTWRAGGEDNIFIRVTITSTSGSSSRKTKENPVAEEDFKVALKVFDQAAKTFWFYDPATRQGKRVALDMSALCSDWKILKSSRGGYLIEYATRDDYAKRAGDEMEQILALYKAVIPTQKTIPPCRIKIFDREEDFQYYSLAYGAAAYWSPMQEEIVCYRFQGDKLKSQESNEEFTIAETQNPEEVTFKVLYHEGFHQYMYFYMGRDRGVYVPSWLNEGMGDYFFGGEWAKTGRKFDIGLNDWRLKTIYNAVKKGEHVPLDKIIRYEQRQYYSNPGLCYAEGWALNYFFQKSPAAQKKGYHAIPRQMLNELKTSGNWEKATDKVFGGLDLKKMEEEWKEFVLSLPVPKDKDDEANQ